MGVQPIEIKMAEGVVEFISGFDKHNSFSLKGDTKTWFKVEETDVKELVQRNMKVRLQYKIIGGDKIITKVEPNGFETPAPAAPGSTGKKEGDWTDDMISFEDLLTKAHEKFNTKTDSMSIETELISYDMDKEWAIVQATVTITPGKGENRHYEGLGDATQKNMASGNIKPHFLRMAETRAIARALRWATNNAAVVDVETQDAEKTHG